MTTTDLKVGDKVRFKPGPFTTEYVEATITAGLQSGWLTTKDAGGKQRKVRPKDCTKIG